MKEAIELLSELVQNTPNYVQMVCFHLVAQARPRIAPKDVEEVLETVVRQNAYAYQTLLNSLTLAQHRVLRLAANERQSLFQKDLLVKYEIASAPALHSSINALKAKGILDEEGTGKGSVFFDDPLFAYWLRLCFNAFGSSCIPLSDKEKREALLGIQDKWGQTAGPLYELDLDIHKNLNLSYLRILFLRIYKTGVCYGIKFKCGYINNPTSLEY